MYSNFHDVYNNDLNFGSVQVFGDKAFGKYGKGFISIHFSDQHPSGHRKMLLFKFVLPDANNMADMTRLVALIPYYIDLVGRYKLSPQVHSLPVILLSDNELKPLFVGISLVLHMVS